MNTISISVSGEELEVLTIELTSEEVSALYKLRKENAMTIATQSKEIDDLKKNKKWAEDARNEAQNELSQAHTLLTALGVQEKTNESEEYYRKALQISTRIALYIAKTKE